MSENSRRWSPYAYGNNNPIRFIDPDGRESSAYGGFTSSAEIAERSAASAEAARARNEARQENNNGPGDDDDEVSESPNVKAGLEKEQMANAFDPNLPRASGRATPDYTLESFAIPLERGITLINSVIPKILSRLAAKGETTVYRVFGGDARAQGFSWTTVKPTSVKDFRNVAGLPSGGTSGAMNTADFMIKGRVNANSIIKFRSALPRWKYWRFA